MKNYSYSNCCFLAGAGAPVVPRRRRGPRLLSWTGGGTAGGCWAGAGGHAAHICGCWASGGTAGGCWTLGRRQRRPLLLVLGRRRHHRRLLGLGRRLRELDCRRYRRRLLGLGRRRCGLLLLELGRRRWSRVRRQGRRRHRLCRVRHLRPPAVRRQPGRRRPRRRRGCSSWWCERGCRHGPLLVAKELNVF
jgi:hypothetical protein